MRSTILRPRDDWFDADNGDALKYPALRYREVDRLHAPGPRLHVGGSWNAFASLPLHRERCLIFENLYFPYDAEFRHFDVRNATILWPRLQASVYTDLSDPRRVYLRKGDRLVALFTFVDRDTLELDELVDVDVDVDVDVASEADVEKA